MLKILQARLQKYINWELPGAQVGLRKTEESEMKLTTFVGSQKKQENPRETYIPASLTMLKPLCGSQETVEKFFLILFYF